MLRNSSQTTLLPRVLLALASLLPAPSQLAEATSKATVPAAAHQQLLDTYCADCHNQDDWAGSLAFETLPLTQVSEQAESWEKVIRKLNGHMMPPPGNQQPEPDRVKAFVGWLETSIDRSAAAQPIAGNVALHRLNRAEYANAIRDLLDLQIDTTVLLPKDDVSDGFDNVANVLKVSPSFLEQYIAAARDISLLAVGNPEPKQQLASYRVPAGNSQYRHVDGLPLGTRGGMLVEHYFPTDGDYDFTITGLAGATYVFGLDEPHTVIMTIDGRKVFEQSVGGDKDVRAIDQQQAPALAAINERFRNIRRSVSAGPHQVGITFIAKTFAESDDILYPLLPEDQWRRITKPSQLQIMGPYNPKGLGVTPSRQRIFVCRPRAVSEELPCANLILGNLVKKAFRHPPTPEELAAPLGFFRRGREQGNFESGIQQGLMAILASPYFLYRVETPPDGLADGTFRINGFELASRLAFFFWSSLPDEELLRLAGNGRLQNAAVLGAQVERMLADPRAGALVNNFAFQWLHVRGLDNVDPDPVLFPAYDVGLREDFAREMALFVGSVFLENQSVLRLLDANYTFVNERLARHYGINGVRGDQFRRVPLTDANRFGIFGKAAMLMVTSYPNRTAPVLRGAWILENILGTPPTSPPPNVEALPENVEGTVAITVRERMELHRSNRGCFACHGVMDPLGFALENFDAIGRWRTKDAETGKAIDASGKMADGTGVTNVQDLRKAISARPEQFAQTLVEKLMLYALGRNLGFYDMPSVRAIVKQAAKDDYRFSAILKAIVTSEPFLHNRNPAAATGTNGKVAHVSD
ncbi:MAG: DUF1592 domain-containing protein [Steroidobacteraceae bacterium]